MTQYFFSLNICDLELNPLPVVPHGDYLAIIEEIRSVDSQGACALTEYGCCGEEETDWDFKSTLLEISEKYTSLVFILNIYSDLEDTRELMFFFRGQMFGDKVFVLEPSFSPHEMCISYPSLGVSPEDKEDPEFNSVTLYGESCWVTVGDQVVYVRKTPDGVSVDIMRRDDVNGVALDTAFAAYSEKDVRSTHA